MKAAFAALAIGLSLLTTGCPDDTTDSGTGGSGAGGAGGGATDTCFDYTGWDGTMPATHLRADVMPLFQRSCGISASCHGDPTSPNDALGYRPYLGPNLQTTPTDADITAILDVIVGKTSQAGGKPIVDAGDPKHSFLMDKLDAPGAKEFCADAECVAGDTCGERMPQTSPNLVQAERDTIRRWIAQGAKDD